MPGGGHHADSEPDLEKWLKLNAEYASVWPNITIKRDAPADAKTFDGVADKLEHISRQVLGRATRAVGFGTRIAGVMIKRRGQ